MQAPTKSIKIKRYIEPFVPCPKNLETEKDELLMTLAKYVVKDTDKSTTINQLENLLLKINDICVENTSCARC